jgi:hypothetical protein
MRRAGVQGGDEGNLVQRRDARLDINGKEALATVIFSRVRATKKTMAADANGDAVKRSDDAAQRRVA